MLQNAWLLGTDMKSAWPANCCMYMAQCSTYLENVTGSTEYEYKSLERLFLPDVSRYLRRKESILKNRNWLITRLFPGPYLRSITIKANTPCNFDMDFVGSSGAHLPWWFLCLFKCPWRPKESTLLSAFLLIPSASSLRALWYLHAEWNQLILILVIILGVFLRLLISLYSNVLTWDIIRWKYK